MVTALGRVTQAAEGDPGSKTVKKGGREEGTNKRRQRCCGGLNEMSTMLSGTLIPGPQLVALSGQFRMYGLAGGSMSVGVGLENLNIYAITSYIFLI